VSVRIELHDYDPAWPERFDWERERIVTALKRRAGLV
jgi:GrpB-like predicted nucleotidyltransferase (UPF0157 family)